MTVESIEFIPVRSSTNVGLFGTGPFGDSLLGPLGTLYWALSGQFTGPFGDSFSISGQQVGLLGTLYWALSGQF